MKSKSSLRIWTHTILAAFLLILWNGVLEARLVVYSEARLAAARLVEMENGRPDLRLTKDAFWLDGVEPLIHKNQQVAYLVKLKPQGFMILSDITEVTPQVFVSFSGDFDTLREHPFLVRILDHLQYDKIHLFYLDWSAYPSGYLKPEQGPDLIQIERNERSWSALMSNSVSMWPTVEFLPANSVAPMLVSAWYQESPYWNYTPRIDGQPTLTGCSATAMAQVMYFWKFPERGQGSHSYAWNNETLYADFNHPYLWDRMRSSYSDSYTDEQADAVARLMSDVGIAIDMKYGSYESLSVPNDNNAFVYFFKYSQDVHRIQRSSVGSWETWFDILKQQMDIRQPSILGVVAPDGSGHAIVADGYRTSPSNQIHVNMGWGGSYDDYYTVSNIHGYGDAELDCAVIDIHPSQFMTLNISASLGGTTKPAPGTYKYDTGSQVQVTAIPDTNYNFVNWSGNISSTQNPVTVTMDSNITIKANFRLMPKLTIQSGANGTTNPVPGVYAYPRNVVVQVTAIPAWYSFFISWTGDATGTANPLSVTMNRDKSICANFRYIYAPTASGVKVLNRSFSQEEYINILSWQANPANAGLEITKYRIYLINNGTPSLLAEVGADQSQYSHRKAGQEKLVYAIVAVHSSGREGAPALVTVQ